MKFKIIKELYYIVYTGKITATCNYKFQNKDHRKYISYTIIFSACSILKLYFRRNSCSYHHFI